MKLILALILVCATATLSASGAPPNFIIINVDDLGYGDIGPYGSDNRTPNLDRMAHEGRKLTSHYAAPVCSPSRAALMTGCYPKRALPIPHVLFPIAAVGLHPDEVTVAEVLKAQGYATACIGKWHLGDQPEFLPTNQGFDSYFGIPYSNDMGPPADGSRSNADKPLPTPPKGAQHANRPTNQPGDGTGIRGGLQPPLPLLENDKVVARIRAPEQFAVTSHYTDRAVDFIRQHRDGPFFLYMPHTAVHFPLYPSDDFRGNSPNGLIGDWAEEVDQSVGRVLDAVREAGVEENTLVIFTSDNGGTLAHGSNNRPLRGGKAQTTEGGIRVCTLAWWPGTIPAGTSTDAITSMMDILPTFAGLSGGKVPDDRKLDGVDISPVLLGDPEAPPRDKFFYFNGFSLDAVRSGPWKLHLAPIDGPVAKGQGRRHPQLFNLEDDIAEANDVAPKHPEVVARLQILAQTMADDLGVHGVGPGCRPLGRVHNPMPLIDYDGTVRPDAVGTHAMFP